MFFFPWVSSYTCHYLLVVFFIIFPVCLYMYVYMCVYLYVCYHVYLFALICLHICMFVCIIFFLNFFIFTFLYVYMFVWILVHICASKTICILLSYLFIFPLKFSINFNPGHNNFKLKSRGILLSYILISRNIDIGRNVL